MFYQVPLEGGNKNRYFLENFLHSGGTLVPAQKMPGGALSIPNATARYYAFLGSIFTLRLPLPEVARRRDAHSAPQRLSMLS